MALGGALREADWLDARRVRAYATMVGVASFGILWFAWRDATGATGNDFLAFWGAAKAVVAGDPAAAYDLAVQERIQTATGSPGWFAFVNPPPFLFAVAPFGWLPYPFAWTAWVALTYACGPGRACAPSPALAARAGLSRRADRGNARPERIADRRAAPCGVSFLAIRCAPARRWALVIKPHRHCCCPSGCGRRTLANLPGWSHGTRAVLLAAFGTATMLGYTTSWDSAALWQGGPTSFCDGTWYAQLRVHFDEPTAIGGGGVLALG